ncbi:PIN domain-containing protein [Candidatus Woesearchaeota archaeon]|nr:PIN domain-containing protein [Candidatus Woesearchaeota archaeon]
MKESEKKTTQILDTSIIPEKEHGITTLFSIIEYPPALETCQIVLPDSNDFTKTIDISKKLRKIGKPIGTVDILIASTCINKGFELVTKDSDYENVKAVEPEFRLKIRR